MPLPCCVICLAQYTKFGEDRPKDLGEVGEQTEKYP